MHLDLVNVQTFQGMRKLQPLLSLMQEIVRHATRKIPGWLVVRYCDPDIFRHIKPRLFPQVINNSFYTATGIKHIIDNQNTVSMTDVLDQVVH